MQVWRGARASAVIETKPRKTKGFKRFGWGGGARGLEGGAGVPRAGFEGRKEE